MSRLIDNDRNYGRSSMNNAQLINQSSGIYQIRNKVTGRVYIGSAVNLARRWKDHRVALGNDTHHCGHLQRSWKKHGAENFAFEVIEECRVEDLLSREQLHLDAFFGNRYNSLPKAYSHLGAKRSHEARVRMKAAAANRKRPGTMSLEHRQRIGASVKGTIKTDVTRQKLSRALKGRVPHENTLKAAAAARRGKPGTPHTLEAREKIRAARAGMRASESARANMSLAKTGVRHSEETRRKMSLSQTARHAAKKLANKS